MRGVHGHARAHVVEQVVLMVVPRRGRERGGRDRHAAGGGRHLGDVVVELAEVLRVVVAARALLGAHDEMAADRVPPRLRIEIGLVADLERPHAARGQRAERRASEVGRVLRVVEPEVETDDERRVLLRLPHAQLVERALIEIEGDARRTRGAFGVPPRLVRGVAPEAQCRSPVAEAAQRPDELREDRVDPPRRAEVVRHRPVLHGQPGVRRRHRRARLGGQRPDRHRAGARDGRDRDRRRGRRRDLAGAGLAVVFSDQLPSGPVATWASVLHAVLAPGGRNCSSTSWAPPGRTWPQSVRRATSIQNGSLKCASAGLGSPLKSMSPDCQPVNDLPCAGSSCQAYWVMSWTRGSRQAR